MSVVQTIQSASEESFDKFLADLSNSSKSTSSVQKTDFKLHRVIGRGTYGKVYMVTHVSTKKVYAMKSIKKDLVLKTDQVPGILGKFNQW